MNGRLHLTAGKRLFWFFFNTLTMPFLSKEKKNQTNPTHTDKFSKKCVSGWAASTFVCQRNPYLCKWGQLTDNNKEPNNKYKLPSSLGSGAVLGKSVVHIRGYLSGNLLLKKRKQKNRHNSVKTEVRCQNKMPSVEGSAAGHRWTVLPAVVVAEQQIRLFFPDLPLNALESH